MLTIIFLLVKVIELRFGVAMLDLGKMTNTHGRETARIMHYPKTFWQIWGQNHNQHKQIKRRSGLGWILDQSEQKIIFRSRMRIPARFATPLHRKNAPNRPFSHFTRKTHSLDAIYVLRKEMNCGRKSLRCRLTPS